MDMSFPFPTASQTVGPFYHFGLAWERSNILVEDPSASDLITITGRVLDGDGLPVTDAMLEVWQADRDGSYFSPAGRRARSSAANFVGFGRAMPDAAGRFEIVTIKPGPVPGPNGALQAPHIAVMIFARGLLRHLVTRIYFSDEEQANSRDPVLNLVDVQRRPTLVAQHREAAVGSNGMVLYQWDVVLQNGNETVFFDC